MAIFSKDLEIIEALQRLSKECQRYADIGKSDPVASALQKYHLVLDSIHESWSESFLGHHALIYIKNFALKGPGEFFDAEWGTIPTPFASSQTNGAWCQYSRQDVEKEIKESVR